MEEKTVEVLKKAGWYPNRKIDISKLLVCYKKKGFDVFPAAIKFIEEFGMLEIRSPISSKISDKDILRYGFDRFENHTTDLTKYIINGLTSRSYVEEYEEYVEEKLVIVGKLVDGHATLMISESGRFFTEYGFFGKSIEEFWDRLICQGHGHITNWEVWEG